MSIVVEVITEYLQTNRRLVVPNFGAFVVKESGERIFSELLCTDDGILSSLLQARGLSSMEVAVTIDRFIFEVRYELERYGYCRLEELGTLRVEPTKTLRLYPPVHCEMPKQMPYIPKPISAAEMSAESVQETTKTGNGPKSHDTYKASPKSVVKPRKKFDVVVFIAAVIVTLALLGILYGFYVSGLSTDADDAAMDARRVEPMAITNE